MYCSTRRAVGDTARHGSCGLGIAYVRYLVVDDGTVSALVFHCHTVVVEDAWQCRLIVVGQVVVGVRHAGEHRPCLVLLLCLATLHDVGLAQRRALLVDVPCQLHHALVHAFRGIEAVEQGAVADGLRVDVIRVEHLVADNALYAVG